MASRPCVGVDCRDRAHAHHNRDLEIGIGFKSGGLMQIAEMLAREAIRYTVALYHKNGDSGNYDNHVNVFHPDCEVVVQGGKVLRGVPEVISAFKAGAAMRKAFEGKNFQRHQLTTSMIEVTSDTTAEGRHFLFVVTELGFDHSGTYNDLFQKHGDRWLIKRREATMEWARADSRFVQWLGQPTKGLVDVKDGQ
jgi:hypothetical protein